MSYPTRATMLPARRSPYQLGSREIQRVPTMNPVQMGGLNGLLQQRARQYRNNGPTPAGSYATKAYSMAAGRTAPQTRAPRPARPVSGRVPPLMPFTTLSAIVNHAGRLASNPGLQIMYGSR